MSGKVTDDKGVPIPGASVYVLENEADKVAETLTDLDGSFSFAGLSQGGYRVEVEITGFLKAVRSVMAGSPDAQVLDIRLDGVPRPAAAKTEQPSEAPAAQKTDTAVFQNAQVQDLPGLNRYQSLETSATAESVSSVPGAENLLLINGNTVSLDSGNLRDPEFLRQIMDSARQMGFQLQEFGPAGQPGPGGEGGFGGMGGGPGGGGPGGGMGFVGMGGRGGRGARFQQSKIEGTLSETYSNSALNAHSYSLTGQTLDKPVQIQNNFSVTLGGVLPFFKTQTTGGQRGFPGMGPGRGGMPGAQPGWSFTYSGSRNRNPLNVLTTVPTDLERSGDFSQTYVQTLVENPDTGEKSVVAQPVRLYRDPNDAESLFTRMDEVGGMDPAARGLLEFIPRANLPCASGLPCVNNYTLQRSLVNVSDQFQGRVSGLRIASMSVGIDYSLNRGNSRNASLFPDLDSTQSNRSQNVGISGTMMLPKRLMVNWQVRYNRTRTEGTNAFAYNRNVEEELGITGVSAEPINWGPPNISYTSYGSLSLAAPSLNRSQTFTLSGGLNKIGSKHSIRAGGDVSWAQRNSRSDSNGRGTFTFTGYATVLYDSEGSQVAGTGYDFADFLLGLPFSTSRRYVDPEVNPRGNSIYLRNRSWNLYVLDNWQVRSNLTLNYGLRYEYSGPTYEKYDRLVSLDTSPDFTEVVRVFPDQDGSLSGKYFSRSLVNPDRNNFAPRIGVAWRPWNRRSVIIRAGYGIGFDTSGYASIAGQLVNQAPFAVTQNLATDPLNPLTLRNGFPLNPETNILNTYAIDPDYRAAFAQQWNLDIQGRLFSVYSIDVTYSGAKGTGLDIVRAPDRTGNTYTYLYQTNGASSIYHGLDIQVSRRFSRGFNMRSSYTFSKSIDDSSGSGGASIAQNDADLKAERSLSSQDRRHNFRTNFTYEFPFGRNRMFLAGASGAVLNFVSGWTISSDWTMASGTPLTARYASIGDFGSGAALYSSLRPDSTGEPVNLSRSERTIDRYFNTAAFAIPAGPYGNVGRNTITGPGTNMVNLSIRKGFDLDDSFRRLDLSWQIQNLFNHPNWSGVSTTINALDFGRVTGVRAMRSMTFNLRIRF